MSNVFIYVFDTKTKDKMIAAGFKLIKENGSLFVFYNNDDVNFTFDSMNSSEYMFSDVLVF